MKCMSPRNNEHKLNKAFDLVKFFWGGRIAKKIRGIAGGTIPRVSTTPSLAAGVVRVHHLWNSLSEAMFARRKPL